MLHKQETEDLFILDADLNNNVGMSIVKKNPTNDPDEFLFLGDDTSTNVFVQRALQLDPAVLYNPLGFDRLANRIAQESRRGRGNIVLHNLIEEDFLHHYIERDLFRFSFHKIETLPSNEIIMFYQGNNAIDGPAIYSTCHNAIWFNPKFDKYVKRGVVGFE